VNGNTQGRPIFAPLSVRQGAEVVVAVGFVVASVTITIAGVVVAAAVVAAAVVAAAVVAAAVVAAAVVVAVLLTTLQVFIAASAVARPHSIPLQQVPTCPSQNMPCGRQNVYWQYRSLKVVS